MMNGKIIVVTHKDYAMPNDKIYLPICVGSGIPALSEKFQPDNTGENISDLNTTYCELTAIYWAWKNLDLKKLDYIGTAHYRRHFSFTRNSTALEKAVTETELDTFLDRINLEDTIISTPKRTYLSSVEKHYIYSRKDYKEIHTKDIERLKESIGTLYPEYVAAANKILKGNTIHMLNMFIMGSKAFHAYCTWLFDVINKTVELSQDRTDQRRYAGALSEFCLDIWAQGSGMNIVELQLLETEKLSLQNKCFQYIRRRL